MNYCLGLLAKISELDLGKPSFFCHYFNKACSQFPMPYQSLAFLKPHHLKQHRCLVPVFAEGGERRERERERKGETDKDISVA